MHGVLECRCIGFNYYNYNVGIHYPNPALGGRSIKAISSSAQQASIVANLSAPVAISVTTSVHAVE
jgi:hypothetical protein